MNYNIPTWPGSAVLEALPLPCCLQLWSTEEHKLELLLPNREGQLVEMVSVKVVPGRALDLALPFNLKLAGYTVKDVLLRDVWGMAETAA